MSEEKRHIERENFGGNNIDEEKRAEAAKKAQEESSLKANCSPGAGMTTYKGVKITVEERNMMMKMDYLNMDCDLKTIAAKYGMTYGTVRTISSKGKWKREREEYKKKLAELREGKLTQVYAAAQVEVNLMYNNAWQMIMEIVYRELKIDNKKESAIYRKDGRLDVYALDKLADILVKAQAGQYQTTGFVGKEVQAKIDLQAKQFTLKEKLSGILDEVGEDIPVDNFIEALDKAIAQVQNVDSLVEKDDKNK